MNIREILQNKYPNGLTKSKAKSIAASLESIKINESNKEDGKLCLELKLFVDLSDSFLSFVSDLKTKEDILEVYETRMSEVFDNELGDLENAMYKRIKNEFSDVVIESFTTDIQHITNLPRISEEGKELEEIKNIASQNLKSYEIEISVEVRYGLPAEVRTTIESKIEKVLREKVATI